MLSSHQYASGQIFYSNNTYTPLSGHQDFKKKIFHMSDSTGKCLARILLGRVTEKYGSLVDICPQNSENNVKKYKPRLGAGNQAFFVLCSVHLGSLVWVNATDSCGQAKFCFCFFVFL